MRDLICCKANAKLQEALIFDLCGECSFDGRADILLTFQTVK